MSTTAIPTDDQITQTAYQSFQKDLQVWFALPPKARGAKPQPQLSTYLNAGRAARAGAIAAQPKTPAQIQAADDLAKAEAEAKAAGLPS